MKLSDTMTFSPCRIQIVPAIARRIPTMTAIRVRTRGW